MFMQEEWCSQTRIIHIGRRTESTTSDEVIVTIAHFYCLFGHDREMISWNSFEHEVSLQ
jgi:hypothetical protein